LWPSYMMATFQLTTDGKSITPYNIVYILDGQKHIQPNDGTPQWDYAKKLYMYTEVNIQFTWTHVGVHFDVEQYAMAICRNFTPANPLWNLLMPHFQDIIYNDREVIRPSDKGVVTVAGSLYTSGQMKMITERMKGLTWSTVPTRVLPTTVTDDNFEMAGQIFWPIVNQYVTNYVTNNQAAIEAMLTTEIKAMSDDVVSHSLYTQGEKSITTIPDVIQFCSYVIYQAIFYHAWVHWNSYDDFFQSLFFKNDSTNPDDLAAQAKAVSVSNMTQAYVTYASPILKQWPILDSELGTPDGTVQATLRKAIQQRAGDLQGLMLVGTYIMAPNT